MSPNRTGPVHQRGFAGRVLRVLRWVLPVGLVALILTLPNSGKATRQGLGEPNPDTADCAKLRCVALTFDDGPGPYTTRLLSILEANNAKATFFELGERIAAHPEWSKEVVQAGELVGVHTWNHPYLTLQSLDEVRRQLSDAAQELYRATGTRATVYRPPAGLSSTDILKVAGSLGLAEILWNVVAYDWEHSDEPQLTLNVVRQYAQPGMVILLHDVHEGTIQAMQDAVPWLKRQGYVLVTVDRLIRAQTGKPAQPGVRYWDRDGGQLDPAKKKKG